MSFLTLLQLFIFTTLTSLANAEIDSAAFPASSIITRDVCIIGGGSTGTYSAIRLSDSGKSVVVVEAKNLLGGHTNTYTDPSTNETVDYGVQIFHNLDIVRKYFARFDIPLQTAVLGSPGTVTEYVDFRTGKVVPGYTTPDPSAGFAAYGAQVAKYPYLETGFNLPDPVPADLLLPFGAFVQKYNLGALVPTLFDFVQGVGNILDRYTLYIFKYFGLTALQDLSIGFLTTVRLDNSELYRKALAELGQNVLLNSHVVATDRSGPAGVKVLVETPTGPKLILAKKLVITIPPKLDNLVGFDLSFNETSLFGQLPNTGNYRPSPQHRDPSARRPLQQRPRHPLQPATLPGPLRHLRNPRPGPPLRLCGLREPRPLRQPGQIAHHRQRAPPAYRGHPEHDGARVRGVPEPRAV